MFDGRTSDSVGHGVDGSWQDLHRRLRSIAKRRVALEAEEASYLVEAEDTQLYRKLGYTSMHEYMERELQYGPHAANERLRVARALLELPLIAELFGAGELCFSAVRELTRVATGRLLVRGRAPDLEFAWRPDEDVESAMSGPPWDWTVDPSPAEHLHR